MRTFIQPRLRKPAGIVLAGAVFVAAWAIHGGPRWWLWAALFGIVAAGRAFVTYMWAAEDDDVGALAGSRADERQKMVSLQSWALSGRLAMLGAFAGMAVAVAVRASWWWPFLAIFVVAGLGYLFGVSTLGFARPDPAEPDEPPLHVRPASP